MVSYVRFIWRTVVSAWRPGMKIDTMIQYQGKPFRSYTILRKMVVGERGVGESE